MFLKLLLLLLIEEEEEEEYNNKNLRSTFQVSVPDQQNTHLFYSVSILINAI